MQTINIEKAGQYARDLMSDKNISAYEASSYVFKNYKILTQKKDGTVKTPQAVYAYAVGNVGTSSGRTQVKTVSEKRTYSKRKATRNTDALHLRRQLRDVIGMSLTDSTKIIIIREMLK